MIPASCCLKQIEAEYNDCSRNESFQYNTQKKQHCRAPDCIQRDVKAIFIDFPLFFPDKAFGNIMSGDHLRNIRHNDFPFPPFQALFPRHCIITAALKKRSLFKYGLYNSITVGFYQNIKGSYTYHMGMRGTAIPSVKYVIELTDTDRKILTEIVSKGQSTARTILRANILLASDRNNKKHMTVAEIADTFSTTPTTVQTVRSTYATYGLDAAVYRKKRETPPVAPKVTGEVEARIIALACGEPPEGYSKWSVRLLADKCVELNYIESISHIKKTSVFRFCEEGRLS